MTRQRLSSTALLLLVCALPSGVLSAQATMDSYLRARAVVEGALEAMGGENGRAGADGLLFEARGTMDKAAERQGLGVDVPSPGTFTEALAVSADRSAAAYRYLEERFDGTSDGVTEIYRHPDQHLIVIPSAGFALDFRSPDQGAARRKLMRRFPHVLLREVLANPAALRWMGTREGLHRVGGTLENGSAVDLWFDQGSGLLRRVAYVLDYQSFGDAEVGWWYDDYRGVDGVGLFPHTYGSTIQGAPFTRMQVTRVATGAGATDALLEVPEGIELQPPQVLEASEDASSGARVDTLGAGLYRVVNLRGGFHPLFLEMGDALVAVDAPAGYRLPNELPAGDVAPGPSSAWLSERYLEMMRSAVPDKPVSHVVVTHFHNDHGGGVRAFVAEGATVVAPAEDTAAIRDLVEAPHTLAPDRLERDPRPLRMRAVDDRLVLEGGGRRVEVLEVGPNPHTRGMLVLHLPDEGVMFVSDLLDPTGDPARFPKPGHAPLDLWFGGWIDAQGLTPSVIYTMHGSGRVTPAHLERLRELRRSGSEG